jgi:hypothetical protein
MPIGSNSGNGLSGRGSPSCHHERCLSRRVRTSYGFQIEWLYPGKEIGAVSRGDVAVFFRRRSESFEPAVDWVFAEDIDATYRELKA